MTRWIAAVATGLMLALVPPGRGAEKIFDLTGIDVGGMPAGFRSALAGTGKPGEWKVLLDDAPLTFPSLTADGPKTRKVPVLAQVSADPTDERFPLLIYDAEVVTDFTLNLKVKTVSGTAEQMAGVAFRLQDERNFYVVRASALGRTFRFYRVFQGVRDNPIGPEFPVEPGVWHDLSIECKGNRIRLQIDGKEPIPEITDNTFNDGKIALWTKSDSVSYFTDLKLSYTARETLARILVRDALQRYPRLLGIRIISSTTQRKDLHVVASHEPRELDQPANESEKECVTKDAILYGKGDKKVIVTAPLHDRNGEPVAAVRLEMQSFPGQTEANAVARAMPVVKLMQPRVTSLKDLTN